jgi:UDP-N-acetyl-D-glucosamine dehydrogenase
MLEETLESQTEHEPETKTWDVAVIGAGYVGVPLAHTLAASGRSVLLIDIAPDLVAALNRGESHITDVPSENLAPLVREGRIRATTDYDDLRNAAAILIALPTPLSKQREPDLSIVVGAVEEIGARLRNGHLVVHESTTYPRTTREVVLPILERTGLKAGRDFFLAFSPERVDPGNTTWTTKYVP